MNTDIYYSIIEHGDERYRAPASARINDDHGMIAERCSEFYHDCHGGWEADWPLTVALYDGGNGPEIARFVVERVCNPAFYATPA